MPQEPLFPEKGAEGSLHRAWVEGATRRRELKRLLASPKALPEAGPTVAGVSQGWKHQLNLCKPLEACWHDPLAPIANPAMHYVFQLC